MKFTPQQCREAFYQAAANIEARPDLYDFQECRVGAPGCSACMWGHVGRVLGMDKNTYVGAGPLADPQDVAPSLGFHHNDLTLGFPVTSQHLNYAIHAEDAAGRLREFADYHWPQESTEPVHPDFRECGLSFVELMNQLSEVKA